MPNLPLRRFLTTFLAISGLSLNIKAGPQDRPQPSPGEPGPAITAKMSSGELTRGLDEYLAARAADGRFSGVVLVAKEGVKVFEKGYGVARRESNDAITVETRFNYASIGKAFTKVAIGQLMAAGTLATSDTLGKLLPQYPNREALGATVDQLLGHQAGVVDFFGPRFDAAPKDRFTSNAEYFKFVAPEPLLFAPGTRRQYCNGCYIVLGEIIAKLSGMPYERYIEERVFKPAGMTTAGFLSYGDAGVAMGYTGQTGELSAIDNHGRRGSAAGGSFGRAADLLAFDNALRERRLLDAKGTAWFYGAEPVETGRAAGAIGIAGGARGANCVLDANGTWTIAVTGNLDPPNAGRVGQAIRAALRN
jgi:CubicO group peptidase (beta-lactamase class C family)